MADPRDREPTDEELALAERGRERIAAAVGEVRAPQSLREAIERDRETTASRQPFWRRHLRPLAVAGAAVTAVAVLAVALGPGDDPANLSEPSLGAVYSDASLPPAEEAPAPVGGDPPELDAAVGALRFPDWREAFGWEAIGRRDTEISGRAVTTVSYRNREGARLGYAVVSGRPLPEEPAGRSVEREGNSYDVARDDGRTIVTWTQQGHTCAIVAPSSVPQSTLVDLAASRDV